MQQDIPLRCLVRVENGIASVLWQDAGGYVPAQSYQLSLRLDGPKLIGYLDAAPLFSVVDNAFSDGKVGLYCWKNPSASFERVLVVEQARTIGQWRVVDSGALAAPSKWHTSDGALHQTAAIVGTAPPEALGSHVLAGEVDWSDCRYAVDLRTNAGGAIGVLFRYLDEDNYYRFSLDGLQQIGSLIKCVNGTVTVMWQDTATVPVGSLIPVVVDAIGDRLIVYLDEVPLLTVQDATFGQGNVGLYAAGNSGAHFERVSVTSAPTSAKALFVDGFEANTLAGFRVVDTGAAMAPSVWQAVNGVARQSANIFDLPNDRDTLAKRGTDLIVDGEDWGDVLVSCRLQSFDDDAIGVSFRYRDADNTYRFSMDSQRSYRRLVKMVSGIAELLWESADGYDVGRTYHLVIEARGNDLRVHLDDIALCAVSDDSLSHGSVGLYCWGNADARFAALRVLSPESRYTAWVLDEAFNLPIPDRWSFDHATVAPDPARWAIENGMLAHGPGGAGLDFALLQERASGPPDLGGPDVGDLRLTARLKHVGTTEAGVIAQYLDEDNFLGLLVGSGSVRLLRRREGVETELARSPLVVPDRAIILTLTCDGHRIICHIDGQILFDLDDVARSLEQVGVACSGDGAAEVHEVRLGRPGWRTHHVFGADQLLPAGNVVELRSGSSSGAQGPSAGNRTVRFVAEAPETGDVLLGPDPQIRLVDPLSQPQHSRSFTPAAALETVEKTVLRNRDGTACFVIPTNGFAALEKFRLRFVFRRDNRALDPDAPVLRQAGDASDEQTTLDIVRPHQRQL